MTDNQKPPPDAWLQAIQGRQTAGEYLRRLEAETNVTAIADSLDRLRSAALRHGQAAGLSPSPDPPPRKRGQLPKRGKRPKRPLDVIAETVEAYYSSGLSQDDFCLSIPNAAEACIQARTLRAWIRRLEQEDPARLSGILRKYRT